MVRPLEIGAESENARAADLLKALGSTVRVTIIRSLAEQPLCVHELVELAGVSQSLLSQHLRVLRAARLVTATRRGKEIVYSLADQHVIHIVEDAVRHSQESYLTEETT